MAVDRAQRHGDLRRRVHGFMNDKRSGLAGRQLARFHRPPKTGNPRRVKAGPVLELFIPRVDYQLRITRGESIGVPAGSGAINSPRGGKTRGSARARRPVVINDRCRARFNERRARKRLASFRGTRVPHGLSRTSRSCARVETAHFLPNKF